MLFLPFDDQNDCARIYKSIPFSLTGAKGDFAMVMSGDKLGIPAGRYQVIVKAVDPKTGPQIPSRYQERDTTPWEVTVPEGGRTDILLKLERR